jgi:hypothetical protein
MIILFKKFNKKKMMMVNINFKMKATEVKIVMPA